MSIATSRGSVTLMGLGLMVIGLLLAALVVSLGELWMTQQRLQDALTNALISTPNPSSAALVRTIEEEGGFTSVIVVSLDDTANHIQATVQTPVQLFFWANWLGPSPVAVSASS